MTDILVVDDEKEITDVWHMLISEMEGVTCHKAYQPEEAIKLIEQHKPQILIVDYNLKADLNGIEVYRKAREACPGLKAIMVSGNADDPKIKSICKDNGIPTVLDKPLILEELLDRVKKLL